MVKDKHNNYADLVAPVCSPSGRPGLKGIPGVTLPPTNYERQFGDPGYPGDKGGDGASGDSGSPGIPGRIGRY